MPGTLTQVLHANMTPQKVTSQQRCARGTLGLRCRVNKHRSTTVGERIGPISKPGNGSRTRRNMQHEIQEPKPGVWADPPGAERVALVE